MPAAIDSDSLDVYVFLMLFAALFILPIPLWFFAKWQVRRTERTRTGVK